MIPKSLLLIETTNFRVNNETIEDNKYMLKLEGSPEELSNKIINEHKNYQKVLNDNNVNFKLFKQNDEKAYDSLFACDWIGTIKNSDFPDGIVFIFPMRWSSRRLEKNYKIVEELKKDYAICEDLSFFEEKNLALESFGVMSLDYHNRIIYCNLSERCHIEPLNFFLELLNKHSINGKYTLRLIESADPKDGSVCFHSGLYIAFINETVFFCKDFVKDKKDADLIFEELSNTREYKYNVILLTYEETLKMCANVLEVNLNKEKTGLLMSKFSYDNYSKENFEKLKEKYNILVVEMDMINTCAGGSLRCMACALF